MNRAIEKLVRTLERMLALYEELLACAKEKTELLVASNVEGLEALHSRESMVAGKLQEIERVKTRAIIEGAEACGCTTTPPTVSAIVLTLGENEKEAREALLQLKEKLTATGKAIAGANRLNEQLCTQALTHLDVYVGLLTGRSTKQATYTAQGKARMYEGRALVSRSA